ncbi:dephospho-CoA kinase, partial [Holdemanella biformis]
DQVNADLLKKGNLGYQKLNDLHIVELDSNGEIIKESLASYMFSNVEHRKQVEAILHPLIFDEMHKWIHEQESLIVFVEMPILFEISAQEHFDSIWCVVADLDVALSRLQTYRNFTREQALARLVSQMNPEEKMAKSDIVLRNNSTVEQLHMQIEDALKEEKLNGD